MNRLRLFSTAIGLALLTACSSYTVKTDYDPTISYTSYKTFDWYAASKRAKGKGSGTDPLMDKRVRASVQAALEAKGFRQETIAEPDFLMTYYPVYQNKKYRTTTSVGGGYGYGWGGRHWGYGVGTRFSTSQLHKYREGTIVLEIVDSKSNQLVWQGAAEGALTNLDSPEDAQEQINKAVRELLANFPPGLKK
jgi:hypothetical protein